MEKNISEIRKSISLAINKYRKENKVSKAKFASLVGVSPTSVRRWVNNECSPDLDLLPKLCEVMNISMYELFGIENINSLTPNEIDILKLYISSISFKTLVDKYRSDENFKASIDYLVNLNTK